MSETSGQAVNWSGRLRHPAAGLLCLAMISTGSAAYPAGAILDDVLHQLDAMDAAQPLPLVMMNGAENVAVPSGNGSILNRVDGSILNMAMPKPALATELPLMGTMTTTVVGASNTGSIQADLRRAPPPDGAAMLTLPDWPQRVTPVPPPAPIILGNFASNPINIAGSITNDLTSMGASAASLSTSVIGAVNSGSIHLGLVSGAEALGIIGSGTAGAP